jgi:hypothetical protein
MALNLIGEQMGKVVRAERRDSRGKAEPGLPNTP